MEEEQLRCPKLIVLGGIASIMPSRASVLIFLIHMSVLCSLIYQHC